MGDAAAMLFIDGEGRTPDTHLPMRPKAECGVFEFELSATLAGVTVESELGTGRAICAFCDNAAAGHAAIRGSGRTRLEGILCSAIWGVLALTSAPIWIEYVNKRTAKGLLPTPGRA